MPLDSAHEEPTQWRAGQMSDADRQAHFAAAKDYASELRKIGRAHRLAGFVVGVVGIAAGTIGITAAAMQYDRLPEPPRWIAVDNHVGWVGEPISSMDAERIITAPVLVSLLRDIITRCESYNPATADLDFHACTIMLSPEQQAIYERRTSKENPLSPRNMLGPRGVARIELPMRFFDKPAGKEGAHAYGVEYQRTEYKQGEKPVTTPWTASVFFALHPDAPQKPTDMTINPTGFQAYSYVVQPPDGAVR